MWISKHVHNAKMLLWANYNPEKVAKNRELLERILLPCYQKWASHLQALVNKGKFEGQELLKKLEAQELDEIQTRKLILSQQMTAYVANMMKDFFTSENIWKVVRQQQKSVSSSSEIGALRPKFIEKREKLKLQKVYKSQESIDESTMQYLNRLQLESGNVESIQFHLEQFNRHLQEFPVARFLANRKSAQLVLRLQRAHPQLLELTSEVLARLGHHPKLNASRGVRILSIDGGGMKGVIALEVLRELERKTGKKIHELFDYMIGVSTGSIIVALLAFHRMTVDEVFKLYEELGAEVFKQTYIKAVTGIVKCQAYYDTSKYESILKRFTGDLEMASTLRDPDCPKVAFVSAIMSSSRHSVTPYIFRNYTLPHLSTSSFRGSSRFKVWEAVRASSSAPGFFDDFSTKGFVFQDGGLIANNPANIGLHESQHLWPGQKLQCLVSCGSGRYEPLLIDPYETCLEEGNLSLKDKFSKLVLSATDTEMVHYTLHDFLPDDKYFRFNPYLSAIIPMDETRPEKISLMRNDSQMYCRRNVRRLDLVSKLTRAKPTSLQRAQRKLQQSLETLLNNNNSLTALREKASATLNQIIDVKYK